MTVFQFLLICGVFLAAYAAIRFLPGDRSLAIKRVFALLFAAAAILAILFPHALTVIAQFFGIGRGADLLLYVSIIGGLFFIVAMVRSKARSDTRVTQLARAVALMEARLSEQQHAPQATYEQRAGQPHARNAQAHRPGQRRDGTNI